MRIFLGLDVSLTSTGITLLDAEKTYILDSLKTTPKDGMHVERHLKILTALTSHLNWIKENVSEDADILGVVEGYAYRIDPKHGSQAITLAEIGGLVRYVVWRYTGHPLIVVAPSTLKLFVAGHGHAKKEQMLLALFKKYGREFTNNDEADSYALALMGLCCFGEQERDLTDYEKRTVATVRKGNPEVF